MLGVAEHDLGIGADVDEELQRVRAMRTFSQNGTSSVGTDVAGNARQEIRRCERRINLEVGGADGHGAIGREEERCLAQGSGIDPEDHVMHDRVPDEGHVENRCPIDRAQRVDAGRSIVDEFADHRVQCGANRTGELDIATRIHHHVRDPRHEVITKPDLRIHHAVARDHFAGRQVDQVAGDGGRPDINGDAKGAIDVAGIHGAHIATTPNTDSDCVVAPLGGIGDQRQHVRVEARHGDVVVGEQCRANLFAQPAELGTQLRLR